MIFAATLTLRIIARQSRQDDDMPKTLQWTPTKVRKFWTAIGDSPLEELGFSRVAGRALLDRVKPYLPADAKTVIDLGAGAGFFSKFLADDGYDVQLFEPAKDIVMPEVLARDNVEWIDPEAPGEPADVLFCLETIEHILEEELDQFFERINRLVKPGGHIVISTPHNEDLRLAQVYDVETDTFFHPWQHVRSFERESLISFLKPRGIHCEAIGTEDFSNTRDIYEELYRLRSQADDVLNTLVNLKNDANERSIDPAIMSHLDELWSRNRTELLASIESAIQPLSFAINELVRKVEFDVAGDAPPSAEVADSAEEVSRHAQELLRVSHLVNTGEPAELASVISAAQLISDAAVKAISKASIARILHKEQPIAEALTSIRQKLAGIADNLDAVKVPIATITGKTAQSGNRQTLPQKTLGAMDETELRAALAAVYSELASRDLDKHAKLDSTFDFQFGAGSTLIFVGRKEG